MGERMAEAWWPAQKGDLAVRGIQATPWMTLGHVMLNERSQTQNDSYSMTPRIPNAQNKGIRRGGKQRGAAGIWGYLPVRMGFLSGVKDELYN